MKPKLLTSIIFGALLPWLYFVVATISPIRYIENGAKTEIGSSGIAGFIEFHGFIGSTIIYMEAALLYTVFIFAVCNVHSYIEARYATKA